MLLSNLPRNMLTEAIRESLDEALSFVEEEDVDFSIVGHEGAVNKLIYHEYSFCYGCKYIKAYTSYV